MTAIFLLPRPRAWGRKYLASCFTENKVTQRFRFTKFQENSAALTLANMIKVIFVIVNKRKAGIMKDTTFGTH